MSRTNSPITNPEIIELTIDSLSYNGGRGVGRYDGVVVFVPGTVPEDLVQVRVTHKKSRLWEAELVQILNPSKHRREPPCPVAGTCGGCSWQNVTYDQQVEQKKKILTSSLRGLVKYGEFQWLPFLPAPQEFHYRNRIQVQIKGSRLGFFAKRSHDLVEVEECWISEPAINRELKKLRKNGFERTSPRIEIAVTESGQTLLMTDGRDPEAALFSQVNTAQNQAMKKALVELIRIQPDWMVDLYAGAGNLTSVLHQTFPQVALEAFELSRASVERGQKTLSKVNWHVGDVEKTFRSFKSPIGQGLVVLDPPRVGASEAVIESIAKAKPQQILYISCNPTTFARDCERLLKHGGYRLEAVQGLDMFPQTEHVELLASLCAAT